MPGWPAASEVSVTLAYQVPLSQTSRRLLRRMLRSSLPLGMETSTEASWVRTPPTRLWTVSVAVYTRCSLLYAMSSILAALLRREREGVGATLDITMFESLGEWMGNPIYYAYDGREQLFDE